MALRTIVIEELMTLIRLSLGVPAIVVGGTPHADGESGQGYGQGGCRAHENKRWIFIRHAILHERCTCGNPSEVNSIW